MTHVPRPRRRTLLRRVLDGLWTAPLWAVPFAIFFGVLFGGDVESFVTSYRASLVFSYVLGYANLFMGEIAARSGGRFQRVAPRIPWLGEMLFRFVGNVAGSYLAAWIIHRSVVPGFLGSPRAWLVSGLYTLLFFGLIGGIVLARAYYALAVERAAAVERARAELARAELRALRAQINPHFLFNTLNTIAALVAENPRAAEDVVTRLADVFRYALASTDHETSRFSDELEFLRSYLAIESVRLGPRLRVVERIEPGLDAERVPSLLLQPLVENAVHHAVAPRTEGGTVELHARREGARLVIEVADDGPGLDPEAAPRGHGVGLASVRERLQLAGPGHDLHLDSAPGRGLRVRLTLPLRAADDAPSDPSGRTP